MAPTDPALRAFVGTFVLQSFKGAPAPVHQLDYRTTRQYLVTDTVVADRQGRYTRVSVTGSDSVGRALAKRISLAHSKHMQNTFRIRGVIGMAAAWAVGLSVLATSLLLGGLAVGAVPSNIFGPAQIVDLAGRTLLAGGLAGTLFAIGLAISGRSTAFSELTDRKVALWGLCGGIAIPAVIVAFGAGTLVPTAVLIAATVGYAVLGAALGVGTLRMARRAPRYALGEPDGTEVGKLPRA